MCAMCASCAMHAQEGTRDSWRRRLLHFSCLLALCTLFVAGAGCPSQPPTAIADTPTPVTTATREPTPTPTPTLMPTPTATTNPYVQRNR